MKAIAILALLVAYAAADVMTVNGNVEALYSRRALRASSPEDCLAAKFFHYNKQHSACVLPSSGATKSGVSKTNQKLIVDKHNKLRAAQKATNMQKMVWDDEVAAIAQRWADNCEFAHDKIRSVPARFSVGQNLAAGYRTWDSAIQGWYDEIKDFQYGQRTSFSKVGHYTQLTWATTAKIGCGYTYCTNLGYKHYYVCNYASAGNSGDYSKPFKQGKKCADCPDSCNNGLCDCKGKVCENGGKLDLNTCQCKCKKSWHVGGNCAMDCSKVKEAKSCSDEGFWGGKCNKYSNTPTECPNYCNVCPHGDAFGK